MVGNLFINSVGKAKYMCLIPPRPPFPLHSMTVVLETNFFTVAYILYSQAYDIPVNLEHYVQYYFKSELLFNESWG